VTDAGYCTALGLIAPPQLADFSERPGITLFQLLVVALLEHDGPQTMPEIAARLAAHGVQAQTGDLVYSLTKAWHGLSPVRRETDQRMRLVLDAPELRYLLLNLGLMRPKVMTTTPEQVTLPDETVPLTLPEWEALIQHPTSTGTSFSTERLVGALLEAHGGPKALADVNRHLESLSHGRRTILPDQLRRWRGRLVAIEEGPSFHLRDDAQELATMRRAVRKIAVLILQRQATARTAERIRATVKPLAITPVVDAKARRRAVIRAFPSSGVPQALSILDLHAHEIRTHIGVEAAVMIQDLQRYDLLIGLDPLNTLSGLQAASERWVLTDLGRHPKTRKLNQRGRTLRIDTAMLISASVGISRPLYDPVKMRAYLAAGDHGKLSRRLESDAKALAAFYHYGCLHGSLRLRWGFLQESVAVGWAQPGDRWLWNCYKEAERLGADVEIVTGSAPGWEEPWARARRGRINLDHRPPRLVTAEGEEDLDVADIQAIRVIAPSIISDRSRP